MDGLTINSICTELDSVIKPNFRGTYGRDTFISEWKHNLVGNLNLFFINSEVIYKQGIHWVLYAFRKDGKIYFYDSIAQQPGFYGLDLFPEHPLITAPYRVQSSYSNLCSVYCIYIARKLSEGSSLLGSFNIFNQENLIQNDNNLIHWFENTNYGRLFEIQYGNPGKL